MIDTYDEDDPNNPKDPLNPLNIKKNQKPSVAVAISDAIKEDEIPSITAAGRGKIAEQIIQLAFENGIKVREDSALADILSTIELDSPIPSEAFMAVAEILSYVYQANGETDPFNAVFDSLENKDEKED